MHGAPNGVKTNATYKVHMFYISSY